LPYACGAPFGASSPRANKVRSTPIYVGKQQSLFVFAFVLAKINVLCFGIAKMLLKKATWVRKFSFFIFLPVTCKK